MIDMDTLKQRAEERLRAGQRPEGLANVANRLTADQDPAAEISQLAGLAGSAAPPKGDCQRRSRPYRLSSVDADAAHADPWDDVIIERFMARSRQIRRRGVRDADAEDLAERLHLRDVHADHRALCLECHHLAGTAATGWRCGNHKAADVARELEAELVTTFQVCRGFNPVR